MGITNAQRLFAIQSGVVPTDYFFCTVTAARNSAGNGMVLVLGLAKVCWSILDNGLDLFNGSTKKDCSRIV